MKLKRQHTPQQWRAKLDSARDLKHKKKDLAIAYKGGKCASCGGTFHQAVYDFHHLDPSIKEARSSIFLNWSWKKLKTELDKCILLCSNCHRIEHYDKDLIRSIDPRKGNKMNVRENEGTNQGLGTPSHGGSETDAEFERVLAAKPLDYTVLELSGHYKIPEGCEVGYVTTDEEGDKESEAS